ncbi:MAG: DinB family protein [Microbacteriaceae bacterium]|nr:DinB family protein [Microbacteriaceae bacterium]MCL2793993.1 DinB family protein [Microbacteriaceae bacterium]
MPITPDDKDWTWVLERPCPECGFDPAAVSFRDVPEAVRENLAGWRSVLAGDGVDTRPDDATWSPLEYAAHVRDVFRIMHARLNLMLVLDDPEFANWDQDATQVEQDYNGQDPKHVAIEMVDAGLGIASAFELVPDAALARTGRRSNGSTFTVETLAAYFLHDVVHHLHDVGGVAGGGVVGVSGEASAAS